MSGPGTGGSDGDAPTLFVQAGNLAEDFDRLAAGGGETFRDQRAIVDHFVTMAARAPVTVFCQATDPYDRQLTPGLRAIGQTSAETHRKGAGRRMLDLVRPARLVARLPHHDLLATAAADGLPTIAVLADIMTRTMPLDLFSRDGIRRFLLNHRLRRSLAAPNVVAVANHGRAATASLQAVLGIPRARTLMHEHDLIPMDPVGADRDRVGFLYVGALEPAKGVRDLITAVGRLGADAPPLEIVGIGSMTAELEQSIARLGLSGRVTLAGRLPNDIVRDRMRAVRAVVVPSRATYGEGMPNVVFEALSTHTPLIVSDHPSFAGDLIDGGAALVFRAGDVPALSEAVRRLDGDAVLRATLSSRTEDVARRLPAGHPTTMLFDHFIADDRDRSGWVRRLSLEGEAAVWL